MADKTFREMTDDELRAEVEKWDAAVRGASSWDATVVADVEFAARALWPLITEMRWLAVRLERAKAYAESFLEQYERELLRRHTKKAETRPHGSYPS